MDEARASAETAVAAFAGRHNALDLVQARLLLAEAALRDGDLATARHEGQRAKATAAGQGRPGWAALASYAVLLARAEHGSGRGLVALATRTADDLEAAGFAGPAVDARLVGARIALALQRGDRARDLLDRVGAAGGRQAPAGVRVRAWEAVALARRASGDRRGALAAVRAGYRVLDAFRASLGATELRAHVSSLGVSLAGLDVGIALERGRPLELLVAAERLRGNATRVPPTRPPDDDQLATDLAELRRLEADRRAGDLDPGALRSQQLTLERRIRDRARRVSGGQDRGGGALDGRRLTEALGSTVLVEYVEADRGLLAVVVGGSTRSALARLGPTAPMTAAIDALRSGLRWLAHGSGPAALDLVRGHAAALDGLLLPDHVRSSTEPVVLVPTGPLARMPWAALPSLAGRAFVVAPSASAWLRASTLPEPTGRRVVLAHGPDLPQAEIEVTELAAAYGKATVLRGEAATVARVLRALDGVRLGHVAAHGRFRADSPMFSALLLADGPLTVHDLERLARPPGRLVLASCDTGVGRAHRGDEVLGLATALLGLGTSGLVAPVVPVADDASRLLMLDLHDGLRAGEDLGTALARARSATLGRVGEPSDVSDRAALAAAWGYVTLGAG